MSRVQVLQVLLISWLQLTLGRKLMFVVLFELVCTLVKDLALVLVLLELVLFLALELQVVA